MTGLLLRLAAAIVMLAALAGGALYAAAPLIERQMAFHPGRYDPQRPWTLPAETIDVDFAAADDVRLHGWLLTAQPPRTGVTVLYLHGNAGTLANSIGDAQYLQDRGFDVFLIDYRGYGRSAGTTESERTLALDGAAAMRWLTDTRGLDPPTIALFGQSLGTTVAVDLAVAGPCRAMALVAPLASARWQAKSMALFAWLPDVFFDRLTSRFDTVGKIGGVRCPVLVVHGDRDRTIGEEQGRAVFDAAPAPKTLLIMPGRGHVLPLGRYGFGDEVVAFFKWPRGP
ncbi:MAG TPA: alpha/beta hydrolase [Reyranella sp.]|nr:alpha/beta hydrolase [Reyranella sp.]